jgi:hypothetical protein
MGSSAKYSNPLLFLRVRFLECATNTVLNNVIEKIGYGSVARETSIFVVVCCVISYSISILMKINILKNVYFPHISSFNICK